MMGVFENGLTTLPRLVDDSRFSKITADYFPLGDSFSAHPNAQKQQTCKNNTFIYETTLPDDQLTSALVASCGCCLLESYVSSERVLTLSDGPSESRFSFLKLYVLTV